MVDINCVTLGYWRKSMVYYNLDVIFVALAIASISSKKRWLLGYWKSQVKVKIMI